MNEDDLLAKKIISESIIGIFNEDLSNIKLTTKEKEKIANYFSLLFGVTYRV
jgi:hypothetical protein